MRINLAHHFHSVRVAAIPSQTLKKFYSTAQGRAAHPALWNATPSA
jgi:hypothetical protein